jgi:hypothetical protein
MSCRKARAVVLLFFALLATAPSMADATFAPLKRFDLGAFRPIVTSDMVADEENQVCTGSSNIATPSVPSFLVRSIEVTAHVAAWCQMVPTSMVVTLTDGSVCTLRPGDVWVGAQGEWTTGEECALHPKEVIEEAKCRYFAAEVQTHYRGWTSSSTWETTDNDMVFLWDTCDAWLDGFDESGECHAEGAFHVTRCNAGIWGNNAGNRVWGQTEMDSRWWWWYAHTTHAYSEATGRQYYYDWTGSCPGWGSVPYGTDRSCLVESKVLADSG